MLRRSFLTGIAASAIASGALTTAAIAQRGPGPDRGRGPDRDRGADGGRWELLGSQRVGFTVDRDIIRVGRKEGRFRAIQLRVRGNDVHVMDLKVIYANGQADDIQVRSEIREGTRTRPLDLKGDRRAIREVQMVYRRKANFRGKAVVEVWGLS